MQLYDVYTECTLTTWSECEVQVGKGVETCIVDTEGDYQHGGIGWHWCSVHL